MFDLASKLYVNPQALNPKPFKPQTLQPKKLQVLKPQALGPTTISTLCSNPYISIVKNYMSYSLKCLKSRKGIV